MFVHMVIPLCAGARYVHDAVMSKDGSCGVSFGKVHVMGI